MTGAEWFIFIIFLIPVYGLLIHAYLEPEASFLFGRSWLYREQPELTEEAVQLLRRATIVFTVVLTLIAVLTVYRSL